MPEWRLVLQGRITAHHRFLLRELMEDREGVEAKLQRVEAEIVQRIDRRLVERLCSIPGVDILTAWTLIAELGTDRSVFNSPKPAASWAGLCPGNRESGGKRLSHRTRQGNRWLRHALVQSAWAASRKKDCLATFFCRHAAKQGVRQAIVSLAHRILVIAFCLLRDGGEYQEWGGDFFDQLNPLRTRNRLIRRLQRLGVNLVLEPPPDLPATPTSPPHRKKRGRPCKCAERAIHCIHNT